MSGRFRSLSRSKDFADLKRHGRSFHVNAWLLVNTRPNEMGIIRCGWTIPRQVGTAVVRNRLKRWGREFFRTWSAKNDKSLDLNLIFKRRDQGFYSSLSHKDFDGALEKLVSRL